MEERSSGIEEILSQRTGDSGWIQLFTRKIVTVKSLGNSERRALFSSRNGQSMLELCRMKVNGRRREEREGERETMR